jgi:hypothetical protein
MNYYGISVQLITNYQSLHESIKSDYELSRTDYDNIIEWTKNMLRERNNNIEKECILKETFESIIYLLCGDHVAFDIFWLWFYYIEIKN